MPSSEGFIPIEPDLLKEAIEEILSWEGDVFIEIEKPLVEGLVRSLKRFLEEAGGCDHSVGICMCSVTGLLETLSMRLEGKMLCPDCMGEGFRYGSQHTSDCKVLADQGFECIDAHYQACVPVVDLVQKEVATNG